MEDETLVQQIDANGPKDAEELWKYINAHVPPTLPGDQKSVVVDGLWRKVLERRGARPGVAS